MTKTKTNNADNVGNKVKRQSRRYSNSDFVKKGKEIKNDLPKSSNRIRILKILRDNNQPLTQADISDITKNTEKEISDICVRNTLMGNSPEKYSKSPVGKGLVARKQMPDGLYYYLITDDGKTYLTTINE